LATLKSPSSGSATSARPEAPVEQEAAARRAEFQVGRADIRLAASPKVMRRSPRGSASHAGSSMFTTAMPERPSSAVSLSLAARYASIVP
jgi:hypothetical protein